MNPTLRQLIFILILAAVANGCEKYKSSYRSGVQEASDESGQSNAASSGSVTIKLMSDKLVAGAKKYKALTRYAGGTSAKTQVTALSSGISFKASGVAMGESDVLTVEIYEGDAIKYIAKRAAVELTADDDVTMDECSILPAPWDGTTLDGSCNWTVEEVK